MKLFSDNVARKRFMKTGLPVLLGIAWSPIVWMIVMAFFGSALDALTGSWLVTQGVVLTFAFLTTVLLLRIFIRIGDKFHSSSH